MIEIGIAQAALEDPSGDRAVVSEWDGGSLVAALDGLGHGYAAAEASAAAAKIIEADPIAPLDEIVRRCHEALAGTRGAVGTLARFDHVERSMTWVGVGNVEGRLLKAGLPAGAGNTNAPVLFGGVLGHILPTVRPSVQQVDSGDVIVLATDGIRSDFAGELATVGTPQRIAELVLERSARGGDDALVVVARWIA